MALAVSANLSLAEFTNRLVAAFPPARYYGPLTKNCDCSECTALRLELPGKRWDEVPTAFVDFNSGSLCLLEPRALVAFLPAWLLRAFETLEDKTVLAEFTLYFLCPGNPDEGWSPEEASARVDLFSREQREVVVGFFHRMPAGKRFDYWRIYCEQGLKWWTP